MWPAMVVVVVDYSPTASALIDPRPSLLQIISILGSVHDVRFVRLLAYQQVI